MFKSMHKRSIYYVEKEDTLKSYEELSSMFESLSKFTTRQNVNLYIFLREYLKFVKNNFRSMKDFTHNVENLKNSFYKSLKSLRAKKEDLFRKPDSKWDLDPKEKLDKNELLKNRSLALEKILYKDTISVNNQKQLYGFYLNRIIDEYERMRNVNGERNLKTTIDLFKRLTSISNDFITNLTESSEILSKKDGQNIKKKEKKVQKEEDEEQLDLEIKKNENTAN